jgi:hypothetical protein
MRTFTRCAHHHPRPTAWRIACHIFLGLCLGLALAAVFGLALEYLWNYLMPGLFHLPAITFCKAVALFILARLLFGRLAHGHHRCGWMRRHRAPSQEGYERWWRGRNEPPAPGAPESQA